MFHYLIHLKFWLLACFLIGVVTGAVTRRAASGAVSRWFVWSGLAFAVGVIVAALGALPGETALFLESALAVYAIFLAGAACGAALSGGSLKWHEGWALGLIPAGLVLLGAALIAQPAYREDLRRRIIILSERAGVDAAAVSVLGRDVRLAGSRAAADAALLADIASAPGVRRVTIDAAPPAAEIPPEAPPQPSASPPVQPPAPEAAPAVSLARLSEASGAAPNCQGALDAWAGQERIAFPKASATIARAAAFSLDKAAALVKRCPQDAEIEVVGYVYGVVGKAENEALARRRAEAAALYLKRQGLSGRRLLAVGRVLAPPAEKDPKSQAKSAIGFILR